MLGLHALIGVFMFFFKSLGDLYLLLIICFFFRKAYLVAPNKRAIIFLYACAYITSVEVLLRMTGGVLFYEASKYLVIVFSVCGIFSKGFYSRSIIYIFYLLLLVPSIYLSLYMIDYGLNVRKAIAFNLSGPYCLGIAAIFVYGLKITKDELLKLLNYLLYPLISIVVYLFVFNPNVSEIITGTGSNYTASGGFGPNQVATVLGLAMFILTTRYFYFSKIVFSKGIDLVLLGLVTFRAIVTFSRGGVLTALIMILAFLFFYFLIAKAKKRRRIGLSFIGLIILGAATWIISSSQTNGFIDKRYANQNATGVVKDDITTGRGSLLEFEFNQFLENPFFGVGVGRVKQLRFEETGLHVATHNEISRIISEHGLLGVLAFLILLITPLLFHLRNRQNLFFFSFYLFWLSTVNHSSMRIAAPAFIYALTLLHFVNEKPVIHRKQVIEQE
jgi:O-antigen ligase